MGGIVVIGSSPIQLTLDGNWSSTAGETLEHCLQSSLFESECTLPVVSVVLFKLFVRGTTGGGCCGLISDSGVGERE